MNLGVRHTKTYIAASFDHDKDAVQKLYDWNEDKSLDLHFKDVHSLTQSYDSSLYCSIKQSLRDRMSVSKTFILIVGPNTDAVTKGACFNCSFYNRPLFSPPYCSRGLRLNNLSYIKYECEIAVKEKAKIIVLYNSTAINKSYCPSKILEQPNAIHIPMYLWKEGVFGRYKADNYQAIKKAINGR